MDNEIYKDGPYLTTALTQIVSADGAVHEVLGPSEKRVSVTFISFQGVPAWSVNPGTFSNSFASYAVNASLRPFTWYYRIHGDVVKRPWSAQANAGGLALLIIECLER